MEAAHLSNNTFIAGLIQLYLLRKTQNKQKSLDF